VREESASLNGKVFLMMPTRKTGLVVIVRCMLVWRRQGISLAVVMATGRFKLHRPAERS